MAILSVFFLFSTIVECENAIDSRLIDSFDEKPPKLGPKKRRRRRRRRKKTDTTTLGEVEEENYTLCQWKEEEEEA